MTIDSGIRFGAGDEACETADGVFIVETKSASGNGIADKVLRGLHQHPTNGCSKYCVGMSLTGAVDKRNNVPAGAAPARNGTGRSGGRVKHACTAAATLTAALVLAAGTAQAQQRRTFEFDGQLQLAHDHFGGLHSDSGQRRSATYLRRARLGATWRPARDWRLGAELDADSEGRVTLRSAAVDWKGLADTTLTFGRFDPDFGLEQAISSKWTTAIERSAAWDLLPDVAESLDGIGLQTRPCRQPSLRQRRRVRQARRPQPADAGGVRAVDRAGPRAAPRAVAGRRTHRRGQRRPHPQPPGRARRQRARRRQPRHARRRARHGRRQPVRS